MRRRTSFDEGLFLVSFSIALALAALMLPAKAVMPESFQFGTLNRAVNACAIRDFPVTPLSRQWRKSAQALNVRCA